MCSSANNKQLLYLYLATLQRGWHYSQSVNNEQLLYLAIASECLCSAGAAVTTRTALHATFVNSA